MKATGIIRKQDTLGRIVLPSIIRKQLEYEDFQAVDIYMKDYHIVLDKYEINCMFCNTNDISSILSFRDRFICRTCVLNMVELSSPAGDDGHGS